MPNPSIIAMSDEESGLTSDFFFHSASPSMVFTETKVGGGDLNRPFHYLAGPMSNIAAHNFPAFNAAATRLRENGYNVASPAELDTEIVRKEHAASTDGVIDIERYRDCLRRDLRIVLNENCVGIICLPEWYKSFGARAVEVYNALWLGLPFFMYDDSREGILLWEFDPTETLAELNLDWI